MWLRAIAKQFSFIFYSHFCADMWSKQWCTRLEFWRRQKRIPQKKTTTMITTRKWNNSKTKIHINCQLKSCCSQHRHERVDLTFFDAKSNGSHFDLGNIPLPVQTNVSGQVLTGIAPISLGSIQNASDILSTLPLTGTIINITHSDTSLITLSHRPSISENGTILHQEDIAKIPGINGTTTFFLENTDQGGDSEEPEDVSDDVPDKKTPKPKSV